MPVDELGLSITPHYANGTSHHYVLIRAVIPFRQMMIHRQRDGAGLCNTFLIRSWVAALNTVS